MNILKTLRKPYISIFLVGLILFVSCTNNDKISDINSQALNEFKMTSINDSKLSNELNDLFGEKNARNNNVNYNQFSYYPNPIDSYLSITNHSKNKSIIIFDINSKIVYESDLNLGNNRFDISDLKTGIYSVKIGEKTFKIIKK